MFIKMKTVSIPRHAIWALLLALPTETAMPANLVPNPGFDVIDAATGLPVHWRTWSPRSEIAPAFGLDTAVRHSERPSLRIAAKRFACMGHWTAKCQGVVGGQAYRFVCHFRERNVDSVHDSIWAKVAWLRPDGAVATKEYVYAAKKDGEWHRIEEILTAPKEANAAVVELVLQWTERGVVWWSDFSLEPCEPRTHRKVKLATTCFMPQGKSTPDRNRELYGQQAAKAGEQGADIVCLGEGITIVGTGLSAEQVAEPVLGATLEALGKVARRYRMYIVAGIYERDGQTLYNTALLIGRDGKLVGKYRKTHLPETEARWGLTPGTEYPVFDTDFGKIGIQICYDDFFPEVARSLAANGAEIIFTPIWGDGREDGYNWDIVARARAIDNAVFFVASIYSYRRSLIINRWGHILADTQGKMGVLVKEVDLDERRFRRWLSVGANGEWRRLYPKERRPGTYGDLMRSAP